ncbi:hypothetical protein ACFL4W_02125, partial [Planctomycetota bacterium]
MRGILFIFLLMLTGAGITAGQDTKVLFDFEDTADLAKWQLRGAKAEITAEHATHGKKAVKITYEAGDGLKTFMHESHKPKINLG